MAVFRPQTLINNCSLIKNRTLLTLPYREDES
jgi:hypothetical protein